MELSNTHLWFLMATLGGALGYGSSQYRTPKCHIRCGVLDERRDSSTLLKFVKDVWDDMRYTRALNYVDMQFMQIRPRSGMTMDDLIGAYMEIGTINVSAIVARYDKTIVTATEKFGVPYFSITDIESSFYRPYNLIAVFPNPADLYHIAVDLLRMFRWREVAVLYQTEEGARLIEELVLNPEVRVRSWKVKDTMTSAEVRDALLEVRSLSVTQVVLMGSRQLSNRIISQALKLSMLSSRYSWIIPSLKQDEVDLADYAYAEVNLTTFHLVKTGVADPPLHTSSTTHESFSQFEHAAVYDSLLTLYHGIRLRSLRTGNCQWSGKELLPTLSTIGDDGATGWLSFRDDGSRQGYIVNILSLVPEGLRKIGYWNSSEELAGRRLQINTSDVRPSPPAGLEYPLGHDVVNVVTINEPPFMQYKVDHQSRTGNDKYEGYCVDLLEAVAGMLDFRYQLYMVPDGQFGSRKADGSWTGMVREIISANASLAVAPLTINSQREEVIDFTKPFKTLGISIIMKKPAAEPTLFQFLEPLSTMVWLMLLGAFLLTSLILYVVDHAGQPRQQSGEVRVSQRLNMQDSVWFTFACLVRACSDKTPHSLSGRLLASALWFFSLIIISSYTANLAAFLTVSKFTNPIQSVSDLAEQSRVRYGTVRQSQVSAFFSNSKITQFRKMWEFMDSVDSSGMVDTSTEGFNKVQTSEADYAFLWDSPVIQHAMTKDCDYTQVGKPFDSRGYGIGVPLGAGYRDELTVAILKLGEQGILQEIEHRWWQNSKCPDTSKASPRNTQSLALEKVAGVFLVLGGGLVLSLCACVAEYGFRMRRKRAKKRKQVGFKLAEKEREREMSTNALCDGHLSSAMQVEEPFLPNEKCSPILDTRLPKQTNIF